MSQPPEKPQNSPTKLAAVAVLGVVFVGVLGYRLAPLLGGSVESKPAVQAPLSSQAISTEVTQEPKPPKEAASSVAALQLPEIHLPSLIAANPFGQPVADQPQNGPSNTTASSIYSGSTPEQAQQEMAAEANEAITANMNAIVRGREAAVLIDGKIVRERDIINNAWRVVSIRQDGIVVEPAISLP